MSYLTTLFFLSCMSAPGLFLLLLAEASGTKAWAMQNAPTWFPRWMFSLPVSLLLWGGGCAFWAYVLWALDLHPAWYAIPYGVWCVVWILRGVAPLGRGKVL